MKHRGKKPEQKPAWRWIKRNLVSLITLLTVLVLATWVYDAVGNKRYTQRIYVDLQDSYEVVAFGDSLIEGLGATDSYGFISRIADRLDIDIYNAGRRRMQTTDAVARLDSTVLAFNPDLVIISIGGNDALRRIPLETIRTNFFVMINRITDTGAKVILLGVDPSGISSHSYDDIYRDLQQAHPDDLILVPNFYDQIAYQAKYLFDPIHPNDEGHEILAQYLEPIVFTTLEEIRASQ